MHWRHFLDSLLGRLPSLHSGPGFRAARRAPLRESRPYGLQSLTSARRSGAARFACSWSTRPLRAGGQQGERPALPGEGTRGRCASPRRVAGWVGDYRVCAPSFRVGLSA
ncbi:hypothetical protein X942_5832 [Burkholderia pseudomallei MSHR5596]|nr:hypothetical protein X942_5832 [Burkholderia pseudomallei MSHR5596]